MRAFLLDRLSAAQRSWLKRVYVGAKRQFVRRFLSFEPSALAKRLRALGLREGDTVMLHSSFSFGGFQGSPRDLIDVFLHVIGPQGNLLMVSLPFRSSTYEYLREGKTFDIRKTMSQMGLISETFRRRRGVLRSFHPTHPVLAYGPKAEWIVADHHRCLYACGPGSPFEKLATLGGKIVFYNVPLSTMTFFHYVEHLVEKDLDFPLYFDEVFDAPAVDSNGMTTIVKARVFSLEAIRRRRPSLLFEVMQRRGLVREAKVGNTRIRMLEANDAIACTRDMTRRNALFYLAPEDRTSFVKGAHR